MLGHVGGRPAVLATERQALEQPQGDQNHRRDQAHLCVARQHADEGRGQAHDHDGDEEGVLAANEVAQPPEHQRPERAHGEAGGEGEQGEDESGGLVHPGEELLRHHRGERAVEIEVVPLEHGPEAGRKDHPPVTGVDARFVCRQIGRGHRTAPSLCFRTRSTLSLSLLRYELAISVSDEVFHIRPALRKHPGDARVRMTPISAAVRPNVAPRQQEAAAGSKPAFRARPPRPSRVSGTGEDRHPKHRGAATSAATTLLSRD